MSIFWHVSVKWINAADRRGDIHAVSVRKAMRQMGGRRRGENRRNTYDAVCGKRFVKPYVTKAVDERGEQDGHVTTVWPPRVSVLAEEDRSRCRECHVLTGKRRPAWPEGDLS